MGADQQPRAAVDFALAVPDGWERIVLDPRRWPHRVDKLVGRGFRNAKDQQALRMRITQRLNDQAAAAHARGGVAMYLAMNTAAGIPLSAGLVATYLPAPGGNGVGDLERLGIARGAEGQDVSMVELPLAGPALRTRYKEIPSPDDQDNHTLPVTHLDIQLPVPGAELHLLLSFSTPMEPLADAMVRLFDSIATTLRWIADV